MSTRPCGALDNAPALADAMWGCSREPGIERAGIGCAMAEIDPGVRAELDALRGEVARLREETDSLRRQVADARGEIALTMRGQTRCPACGAIELLHAVEILDRGESNWRNPMSLAKKGVIRDRPFGQFECYVCTGCGLVEWYCDGSSVEPDGEKIRRIEGSESSSGPYR